MPVVNYIGDTSMFLNYIYALERQHKLTIPIKACGLDRIVLEHADFNDGSSDTSKGPKLLGITVKKDDDDSYLDSEWANPKGLQKSFQGIDEISWKPK